VPRTKSPARLIIALSVAGVLAIFLVYVAIAGGTPQVKPSNVAQHKGSVVLVGTVVSGTIAPLANDGKRFLLRDRDGTARFPVVYRDAPPDQFKGGRSEDAASIRASILAAAPGAREIGDRGLAIRTAVRELSAGDVLVVAGKGHETGQIVGDRVLPFDDALVARECAA
jgi:hypothetical protein